MSTNPTTVGPVPEAKELSVAGAMLDKARSTPFSAEKEALATKAYVELARYLNSLERSGPGGRRRERRLLTDRRAHQHRSAPTGGKEPLPAAYRPGGDRIERLGRRLDLEL